MSRAKTVSIAGWERLSSSSSRVNERIPTCTSGTPSSTTRRMAQAWLCGLPL
jgi:hypothetical protein